MFLISVFSKSRDMTRGPCIANRVYHTTNNINPDNQVLFFTTGWYICPINHSLLDSRFHLFKFGALHLSTTPKITSKLAKEPAGRPCRRTAPRGSGGEYPICYQLVNSWIPEISHFLHFIHLEITQYHERTMHSKSSLSCKKSYCSKQPTPVSDNWSKSM